MASRRHNPELPTILEIETETESSDVSMEAAITLTIDDEASVSSPSKKRGRDDNDDEYYGRRADVADDDDADEIAEMIAELTVVPSSKPTVIFEYNEKCLAMKVKASELIESLKSAAPDIKVIINRKARKGNFFIKLDNGKMCICLRNQRSPYPKLRALKVDHVVEEIMSMVNQG
ncbi:hypothetical protein BVRB_2g034860 [Beta vulgaris subsp. vulgaris]|nr:hypothetical protein BVRB_2g034860 [Beta vulgaris subsp. vulgaris]